MKTYHCTSIIALIFFISPLYAVFKLGIENIEEPFKQQYAQKQIGLITNQTGKDQQGNRTLDLLLAHGFSIKKIMVPEHGFNGTIPAGMEVFDSIDQKTKVSIVSLYGKNTGKKINYTVIGELDVLMVDIQDIGMRHFTYISTLYCALEAAAHMNKTIIIFDRPNPLGAPMEGPLVAKDLYSFVSIAPIPLRHGMTIGELAQYFNKHILQQSANLIVVPMKNYNRTKKLPLSWPYISPNIKSTASCYGYSFLGLLGEVEPFYCGVGTDKAFQRISLPHNLHLPSTYWDQVRTLLKQKGVESQWCCTFNKKKKQHTVGLAIKIEDINKVKSFETLLALLDFFNKKGVRLSYSSLFDKAIGTKNIRYMLQGKLQRSKVITEINNNLKTFFEQAKDCFLYQPHPLIKKMS